MEDEIVSLAKCGQSYILQDGGTIQRVFQVSSNLLFVYQLRSPYFRLSFLWLNFHKNKTTQTFSCITSDSIGWRKYLLPSRVNAYIYIYPILRTANSIADILAWYYYAWALLEYITRLAFRRVENKIRQLFYILSGSSRQKSWHDVIMPERL